MACEKRPPVTRDEICDALGHVCDGLSEWISIIGDDPRDDLEEIQQVLLEATNSLARLLSILNTRGMKAAEPIET
jgi:hypothetical protein